MKIDPSIYDHPSVQKSMARLDTRYASEDEAQTLWLRIPWEPGDEPTTFSSSDPVVDCVAIYDPVDGKLI